MKKLIGTLVVAFALTSSLNATNQTVAEPAESNDYVIARGCASSTLAFMNRISRYKFLSDAEISWWGNYHYAKCTGWL